LTGSYDGAPFGLNIATPAVADSFNLGLVVWCVSVRESMLIPNVGVDDHHRRNAKKGLRGPQNALCRRPLLRPVSGRSLYHALGVVFGGGISLSNHLTAAPGEAHSHFISLEEGEGESGTLSPVIASGECKGNFEKTPSRERNLCVLVGITGRT
jgi:hypothetical protein